MAAMSAALLDELRQLSVTEETGSYAGSVYEGGNARIRLMMDDKDMTRIVNRMMAVLSADAAFCSWLDAQVEGVDHNSLFSSLKMVNDEIAMNDRYSLDISLVQIPGNDGGALSATLLNEFREQLSFSGVTLANGYEAVLHLPLAASEAYIHAVITMRENGVDIAADARQSKMETTWDEIVRTKPVSTLQASVEWKDDRLSAWAETDIRDHQRDMTLKLDSTEMVLTYGLPIGAPLLTIRAESMPDAPITQDVNGLTIVDVEKLDAETAGILDETLYAGMKDAVDRAAPLLPTGMGALLKMLVR